MGAPEQISRVSIDPLVFASAPEYRRTILLARVVRRPDEDAIGQALHAAHRTAGDAIANAGGEVTALPVITAWREAFRALGINPSKFRPSIDALLRRVASGHVVETGIPLVDAGTAISLAHNVPVGIHVIDGIGSPELALRPAGPDSQFIAFDGTTEGVPAEELVWACGEVVMTRRWVWRQGRPGSIDPERPPERLAINVDQIAGADGEAVAAAVRVLELCGVELDRVLELNADTPAVFTA